MLASGQLFRMLGYKIWQNYLMPSRLSELVEWYRLALDLGYTFYSIEHYWRLTNGGRCAPPAKSIVLRHDVDVDVKAARRMFDTEQTLGIIGSYYFRLSTMDVELMRAIAAAGGEASYHYEELGSEAKAHRLRSSAEVLARLPYINRRFQENLSQARKLTGLPMATVASHGDWINRALGLANTEMFNCSGLHESSGVHVEAYDQELLKFVTARYSDASCPRWWQGKRVAKSGTCGLKFIDGVPATPAGAVRQLEPILYVLLHPEQWERGPGSHFKQHIRRVAEGIAYRFGSPVQPEVKSEYSYSSS